MAKNTKGTKAAKTAKATETKVIVTKATVTVETGGQTVKLAKVNRKNKPNARFTKFEHRDDTIIATVYVNGKAGTFTLDAVDRNKANAKFTKYTYPGDEIIATVYVA